MSDEPGALPPPQWAPDPTGRHVQRYWDGTAWTSYVATAAGGEPTADPLDDLFGHSAPVVVAADADPRDQVDVAPGDRRRRVRAVAWLALDLAVVVEAVLATGHGSGGNGGTYASSTRQRSAAPQTGPPGGATTTGSTRPRGAGRSPHPTAPPSSTRPVVTPSTTRPAAAGRSTLPSAKPHSVDQAQDAAAAEQVALRRSDLPPGWSTTASAFSNAFDSPAPECAALHKLLVENADARVEHDFANGGQRVASSVNVLPVRSEAVALVDTVGRPAAAPCLGRVFTTDAGTVVASTEVRRLSVSSVGDRSGAVEIVARRESASGPVLASADLVVFHIGRTAVLTVFESRAGRYDGPRDALLRAVAARVR